MRTAITGNLAAQTNTVEAVLNGALDRAGKLETVNSVRLVAESVSKRLLMTSF